MKYYINYTEKGKILGFTKDDTDLNIEVSNSKWVEGQSYNKIIIDGENISFEKVDWRTEEEIEKQRLLDEKEYTSKLRDDNMLIGDVYKLNDKEYTISFTKEDGDGLVQVKSAFELGLIYTVIHFSNGTKMPINKDDFIQFALWFVNKRNEFFK